MSEDAAIDALEDSFQRTPRCAVHADRDARRTPCARCGSYACEVCFERPDETLCRSCRDRVGEVIPWERDEGGTLARYWGTLVHVLPAPYTAFQGIRAGHGVGSAMLFAGLSNLVSYGLPMLVCTPCMIGLLGVVGIDAGPQERDAPMALVLALTACTLLSLPLMIAGIQVVLSLAVGLVYHGAARLAGGEGSLGESLRVALFTNVLAPVSAAAWVLGRIPILGILITLASYGLSLLWQTFALAGHAHGVHRIQDNRAWLVAAVPALATIAAFVGLVLFFVFVVFATLGLEEGFLEGID